MSKRAWLLAAGVLALLAAAGLVLWIGPITVFNRVSNLIGEQTPAGWFIFFLVVLPMAGFPISFLLVLAGVKFGPVIAMLLLLVTVPLHLLVAFGVGHTFLRRYVDRLMDWLSLSIPSLPRKNPLGFTLLFIATPGLAYTLKNYFLVLTRVPFRYYFWVSWPVHFIVGLPFILLGGSAKRMNVNLFLLGLALLAGAYMAASEIRKRARARSTAKSIATNGNDNEDSAQS